MPKGATKNIDDYELSRYAGYLIVQNADPRKKVVAYGQTYFAVQTRKQEITEEYFNSLNENKKRLITRGQTIAKRKGITDKDDILDYMGSEELADNLFRIVQTEAKLKNEKISNEKAANMANHEVGKAVRETIKKIGGTLPEDLPTPDKSISQIELEELSKLEIK